MQNITQIYLHRSGMQNITQILNSKCKKILFSIINLDKLVPELYISLSLVLYVGIDNNAEEEKMQKYGSITYTRNYVKNSNRETTEPYKIHYSSERLHGRRRESSHPLCIMTLTID